MGRKSVNEIMAKYGFQVKWGDLPGYEKDGEEGEKTIWILHPKKRYYKSLREPATVLTFYYDDPMDEEEEIEYKSLRQYLDTLEKEEPETEEPKTMNDSVRDEKNTTNTKALNLEGKIPVGKTFLLLHWIIILALFGTTLYLLFTKTRLPKSRKDIEENARIIQVVFKADIIGEGTKTIRGKTLTDLIVKLEYNDQNYKDYFEKITLWVNGISEQQLPKVKDKFKTGYIYFERATIYKIHNYTIHPFEVGLQVKHVVIKPNTKKTITLKDYKDQDFWMYHDSKREDSIQERIRKEVKDMIFIERDMIGNKAAIFLEETSDIKRTDIIKRSIDDHGNLEIFTEHPQLIISYNMETDTPKPSNK